MATDMTSRSNGSDELPAALALAFAPLHKRALGTALGVVAGGIVFSLTVVHLVFHLENAPDLRLLGEYFYGYTISWRGALIGLFWGFVSGFVAGWFIAFSRNLVLAISLFIGRTRSELAATRDFLDHI